jgi:hypothetical protein
MQYCECMYYTCTGRDLRVTREGLEGYVADFNNMVREVFRVTGDTGIEVVPIIPVCFEGLDKKGKELLGGLRMWINWIGEKSERKEFSELAGTAGWEKEGEEGCNVIWKPTFVIMQSRNGGKN